MRFLDPDFIDALAKLLWPIAVVVIALIFRGSIAALLNRIRKANLFGNEVEFAVEQLKEAADEAAEAAPSPQPSIASATPTASSTDAKSDDRDAEEPLFFSHPVDDYDPDIELRQARTVAEYADDYVAAVTSVTSRLEYAMRRLLAAHDALPSDGRNMGVRELASLIRARFKVASSFEIGVRRLWDIRNSLMHGVGDISPKRWEEVISSGLKLLYIVLGLPMRHVWIGRCGLKVFRDSDMTQVVEGLEGLVICVAPAEPDAVRTTMFVASKKLNYYRGGWRVSLEWLNERLEPWPLWIKQTSDAAPTALHRAQPFAGRHIEDLTS